MYSSAQTQGGEHLTKVLSDMLHCEVHDWLMTRLLIDSSGRSGVAVNSKISEFKEAVYYPGNKEDPARYRILVKDHKSIWYITSSQVSTCVWRTFQREGVEMIGRICATVIRKSLTTGIHVHLPEEKDHSFPCTSQVTHASRLLPCSG